MWRIDRLASLAAVRRLGTLAAAAESLHLTPSAVSQQLTRLEQETGLSLLVPHGRGVRLTPAAHLLADAADAALDGLDAARVRIDELGGRVSGVLRVGGVPTAMNAFVLTAMAGLRAEHPDVVLEMTEAEPDQSVPAVIAGDLDIAVVESWDNMPLPRTPGTTWTALCDEPAVVVLDPAHPAVARGEVTNADVAGLDWVAWSAGSHAQQWMRQTLLERGLDARIRHHVTSYTAQFALVAELGVAALTPRMAIPLAPTDVAMVPLRPELRRTLYAVTAERFPRATVRAGVAALVARTAAFVDGLPG